METYSYDRRSASDERTSSEPLPKTDDRKVMFDALLVYNTTLAKLMQQLKRDAGAKTIKQNYRGTGAQAFRRQLYVNFASGASIDLWLDKGYIKFGGVVAYLPEKGNETTIGKIAYGDMTPEEVYGKAARILKAWANP